MTAPSALPCAVFLLLAFGLAGIAHVLWLRSPWSRPFVLPIDGGASVGGRRVFGDNKTVRGLMVMPVASAAAFAFFAAMRDALPPWLAAGIWDLPEPKMAAVGFVAGLAFMLAELPNSYFKRRIGVAPGEAPASSAWRVACLVIDRCDSTLGVLIALTIMLPVHAATWLWALVLGSGLHWLFSVWLYRLKLKRRPS